MQQSCFSNLSKTTEKALEGLKSRQYIVITKADSREETIVLDVNDYVGKCERQLGNTKYYKKLKHNATATNNETTTKCFSSNKKRF